MLKFFSSLFGLSTRRNRDRRRPRHRKSRRHHKSRKMMRGG